MAAQQRAAGEVPLTPTVGPVDEAASSQRDSDSAFAAAEANSAAEVNFVFGVPDPMPTNCEN
eukprot:9924183-Karenia_brevis.AAC.1